MAEAELGTAGRTKGKETCTDSGDKDMSPEKSIEMKVWGKEG